MAKSVPSKCIKVKWIRSVLERRIWRFSSTIVKVLLWESIKIKSSGPYKNFKFQNFLHPWVKLFLSKGIKISKSVTKACLKSFASRKSIFWFAFWFSNIYVWLHSRASTAIIIFCGFYKLRFELISISWAFWYFLSKWPFYDWKPK